MKKAINLIILLAGFLFISCQTNQNQKFDKADVTKKLMEENELFRQAVLKTDINALRELEKCYPDSVTYITDGTINWEKNYNSMTDEEMNSAFGFDKIKYTEMKNLQEPVINFSPDGMMAYEYGKMQYTYETKDSLGNTKNETFIASYLSIWEKRDTCWANVAVSQTYNYNPDK